MQKKNKQPFSNKSFGYMLSAIFLVISFYFFSKDNNIYFLLLLIALLNLIITLFVPKIYTKPTYYWYKFAMLLHAIISPVIMLLVYFFAILIIGLLMKAFRKDPLLKKNDPNASSYWIKRKQSIKKYFNLNNQF